MELIYVIPADAAEASPNGKFSLLGGGIENIYVSTFPAVHPGLALVVRLRVLASEAEQSHNFRVDINGPNDFHVTAGEIAEFRLKVSQGEHDRSNILSLIVNMSPLVFPEPGTYLFQLYVDSQEVGQFPLFVQKLNIDEVSNT